MTTNFRQKSAKIYDFPQKPAAGVDGHRRSGRIAVDLRPPRFTDIEFGSGWYHEAALQEAEPARKS